MLAATATVAVVIPGLVAPVNAATPVVIKTSDFEDGTTQGWTRRGTVETVANATTVAHAGTRSLSITGRTASWNGPQLDLLSTMQKGTRYTFSVWVQLASGSATTPMRMSVERRLGTVTNYETVVNNVNASAGTWVNLTGGYTLGNDVDFLTVYVESASGTPSFFIDDFTMSYIPVLPIQTNIPSLKDALSQFPAIGAAVAPAQLLGDRANLLRKHFNSVTPGNAMKWDATEPTAGNFVYTDADAIVNFAAANAQKVRGHTLVWHQQTPAWVFQDASGATMTPTAANKTLLLSRLQSHINAVAGHFRGKLAAWDVVNEVLNEDGTLRNSMWYQITGLDYIRNAFTWARAADPTAVLCINDYNLTVASKRDGMFNLVQQLKGEGIPIDCIGSQMHGNINWPTGADTGAMLDRFAPLGVTQQITEMDISVYTDNTSSYPTISDALLTTQATRYNAIFAQFRSHASMISSITFWGLSDDDSWLNTFPINRLDAPLLFDVQLQAKPAFWSVIGQTPPPSGSTSASASPSPSRSASASPSASPSPSRSASASPTTGTASCRVTYAIVGSWPGGFQGDVKVTNTGTAAINGWTLRWTFANGQTITQLWSGSVAQSSGAVTVTNASYNGPIGLGATVNFGFLASWNGTNAVPTAFTLNNSVCSVG